MVRPLRNDDANILYEGEVNRMPAPPTHHMFGTSIKEPLDWRMVRHSKFDELSISSGIVVTRKRGEVLG